MPSWLVLHSSLYPLYTLLLLTGVGPISLVPPMLNPAHISWDYLIVTSRKPPFTHTRGYAEQGLRAPQSRRRGCAVSA